MLSVATACGTSTGESTASASEQSARPPACTAPGLSGGFGRVEPAAGNRYTTLWLTNTSATPCTLNGYGGLQLVGPAGEPVPTDLREDPDPAPVPVRLGPGDRAGKDLHWGVIPVGEEPADGPCEPVAAQVRVTPPGGAQHLSVPWPFRQVCGHGTIWGSAYHASGM